MAAGKDGAVDVQVQIDCTDAQSHCKGSKECARAAIASAAALLPQPRPLEGQRGSAIRLGETASAQQWHRDVLLHSTSTAMVDVSVSAFPVCEWSGSAAVALPTGALSY